MSDAIERDDPLADVRAAISSLQKGASSPADAPPPPDESALTPQEDGSSEAALDRIADTDKPRDEKGRFVSPKVEDEAPKPEKSQEAKAPAGQATATEPQPTVAKPPASWSPAALAEWAKLPPGIQQEVLKRERDFSNGIAQKSGELKAWKELEPIIAARRPSYQQYGFKSDAEAINHLFAFSDSYARDPAGLVAHLATVARLRPEQVFPQLFNQQQPQGQQQQPQQQAPQPPQIDALVQEQIGMQFARLETEQFAADPKHEHFSTLRPMMAQLLQAGIATNLQDAYDRALWATPDLREKLLADQKSQAAIKVTEDQKARAEKAKRASNASLNGAPHGVAQTRPRPHFSNPIQDAAEDVRAAIEQLR
jgi:hypothetical protein